MKIIKNLFNVMVIINVIIVFLIGAKTFFQVMQYNQAINAFWNLSLADKVVKYNTAKIIIQDGVYTDAENDNHALEINLKSGQLLYNGNEIDTIKAISGDDIVFNSGNSLASQQTFNLPEKISGLTTREYNKQTYNSFYLSVDYDNILPNINTVINQFINNYGYKPPILDVEIGSDGIETHPYVLTQGVYNQDEQQKIIIGYGLDYSTKLNLVAEFNF